MISVSEVTALRIENACLKEQLAGRDVQIAIITAASDMGVKISEQERYDLNSRAFVPKAVPGEPAAQSAPEALE